MTEDPNDRFDKLLKAMADGEPPKRKKSESGVPDTFDSRSGEHGVDSGSANRG